MTEPAFDLAAVAHLQMEQRHRHERPRCFGPTFPFVAGMMNYLGGVDQGEQFYTNLSNNGLHVYLTNGNTLAALEAGIIKLALIQSSAGIGAGLKTPDIKVKFLVAGHDVAERPRHRRQSAQGRAARSRKVHRVRAVDPGPAAHAVRRPDR